MTGCFAQAERLTEPALTQAAWRHAPLSVADIEAALIWRRQVCTSDLERSTTAQSTPTRGAYVRICATGHELWQTTPGAARPACRETMEANFRQACLARMAFCETKPDDRFPEPIAHGADMVPMMLSRHDRMSENNDVCTPRLNQALAVFIRDPLAMLTPWINVAPACDGD